MKIKTLLFTVHRWLGIVMCLFFALWFASGIVMMYVEYPELTHAEELENLPELDLAAVRLSPAEALAGAGAIELVRSVSLQSVLGKPAYLFQMDRGGLLTVFADSGDVLDSLGTQSALAAARLSGFSDSDSEPEYRELMQMDQWTVSESLGPMRPLHRVALNDAEGTELYISDRTGLVVRDTNRRERFWNWLGSTVHWIYPVQLRQYRNVWVQTIIYISLLGLVSIATGAIIGVLRLRIRNPFRGKYYTPYTGMMKWHHVLGLVTVIFVFTFTLSGLMSMGPWGIFDSHTSAQPQIERYTGQDFMRLNSLPATTIMAQEEQFPAEIKKVSWHYINGEAYLVAVNNAGDQQVWFGSDEEASSPRLLGHIMASIPRLLPESKVLSIELLSDYDDYYYARHNAHRPLPVYRARFDDEENTWYHIDQDTGEPLTRVTNATRLERWLFNGLHSLDFQLLWRQRPLWDVVVIMLSMLGLVFSITSVVIAWRYIRGKNYTAGALAVSGE